MKLFVKIALTVVIISAIAFSIYALCDVVSDRALDIDTRDSLIINHPDNPAVETINKRIWHKTIWMYGLIISALGLIGSIFAVHPALLKKETYTKGIKQLRTERATAKAEKAEAAKTARIAELEKEISELKKD